MWFFRSSHPPPYFFCVCFSFPPPPSPSPPALFPLVVFWTPPRVRGADGWGFTGTLGSRSSSCSIGLCPGSSSATKNKKKTQTKNPHIYWLNRYLGEHKPLPCCSLLIIKGEKNQKTRYLPVVLPVVIPVSVVVVVATVKSVVVASVAVIEVTVTLEGGGRKQSKEGGGVSPGGKGCTPLPFILGTNVPSQLNPTTRTGRNQCFPFCRCGFAHRSPSLFSRPSLVRE